MTRGAIEGFLDRGECCELVALHDRLGQPQPDFMPGYRHTPLQVLLSAATSPELDLLDRVRSRMAQVVRARLTQAPVFPQHTDLVSVSRGAAWGPHADNHIFDFRDFSWKPNRVHFRTCSAILYLNDCDVDYAGGEFQFQRPIVAIESDGSRRLDFESDGDPITPRAGLLLYFTSGPENVHKVGKIRDGSRYVLKMFFCYDDRHAEPLSYAAAAANGAARIESRTQNHDLY